MHKKWEFNESGLKLAETPNKMKQSILKIFANCRRLKCGNSDRCREVWSLALFSCRSELSVSSAGGNEIS